MNLGTKLKRRTDYPRLEMPKRCTGCKIVKDSSDYFSNPRGKDGLTAKCKPCTKQSWASLGSRWSGFHAQARRDGNEITLTREEWESLIKKPCHYCRGPLPTFGRGLDRKDFDKPYSNDNVLPCCGVCNEQRGRAYSVEEQEMYGAVTEKIRAMRIERGLPPPGKKNYGGSTKGETQKEKRARTKQGLR